ncbi:hypothetical protein F2Q69_00052314 [Brassica cretica]|uniref:Uncharacterized protein n=1 Tax=Brassica cretica TaxID=69181 RepID=A0A8S9N4I4_BRACR|nr:hypothetical protein F2Q69_00052314 [Brassica cretica]
MHGFVSYRRFGRARSLRSDRTERTLVRYVATERQSARSLRSDRARRTLSARAGWALDRYVATEFDSSSVTT